MSCEICGRSACIRSFHSLEEQAEFDKVNKTDELKTRIRDAANRRLNRLKGQEIDGVYYIKLDEAIDAINDAIY